MKGMNFNSDLQLNSQLYGEIYQMKANDVVENASRKRSSVTW